MGEETLLKEKRITRRESMTFAWVFKNSIALELTQIQPIFSYIHVWKC